MNLRLSLLAFPLTLALLVPVTANADYVSLGESQITFGASGSPNTIAGSWSALPLAIQGGSYVHAFEIEISELRSNFGPPSSLAFDSNHPSANKSIAFCENPVSCIAPAEEGAVVTLFDSYPAGATNALLSAWDFLLRITGEGSIQVTSGQATVSFLSGGGTAAVSGALRVQAYGTPALVPIPASALLLFAPLLFLRVGWVTHHGRRDQ